MFKLEGIKKELYAIEDTCKKDIEAVCDYIFKNPELGEKEFLSSKYQIGRAHV